MKSMKLTLAGLAAALLMGLSLGANAHTIAFGTVNAGTAGSVTFWMGSYHTGNFTQGSISIGSQTVAFGNSVLGSTPPAGLVLGTNLFFADNGATGSYTSLTNPCCAINSWQSATLTGLSAGNQTYSIGGMTSVHWADWNSSQANWTGTVFVPNSSVVTASEPGTLAILGLGLMGVAMRVRRRRG